MLNRSHTPLALIAVAALVTACAAAGPGLATGQPSIPALAAGQARLVFYRPHALFGAGMQPDIYVCGQKVGQSVPGGVFHVDLPPGRCELSIPAILHPGRTRLQLSIGSPAVQYLRTGVGTAGFDGLTDAEVVSAAVARTEMQGLALSAALK